MATGIRQRWLPPLSFLCCLILAIPGSALAQQGGIGGRVSDVAGGAGLEAARVILTGTGRIETTDREGHFLFRGVAPGTYQVRVLRVGIDQETDELECLIALIELVKGRHDYKSWNEYQAEKKTAG